MSDAAQVVLISHPMLAPMRAPLEAQGWRVVGRWEMTEAEQGDVRAIVHAGEVALTPEFLSSLPKLGLIANVSVGYDGVDAPWCRSRGIEVTHAKGLNAEDVADHALGLLIAALKDGRLGRAGLDVFAEEPTPPERWADVPNTVLTPHTAGGTTDSIPRMVAQAVENVRLFLAGEPVMSPVS